MLFDDVWHLFPARAILSSPCVLIVYSLYLIADVTYFHDIPIPCHRARQLERLLFERDKDLAVSFSHHASIQAIRVAATAE